MEDPRKEKEKMYAIRSSIILDLEKYRLEIEESTNKKVKSNLVKFEDVIKILNKHL